jgi:hypothetical protein
MSFVSSRVKLSVRGERSGSSASGEQTGTVGGDTGHSARGKERCCVLS